MIRELWGGGLVEHRGRHYTVENARLYTLPDELPPILAAGDLLDDNRDGMLTRVEAFGTEAPPEFFASVDVDRNGTIARDEWHWTRPASIAWTGTATDGCPERNTPDRWWGQREWPAARRISQVTHVVSIEGRAAGREDRERNQGWDLEGQRELEQADSGYRREWACARSTRQGTARPSG